MFANIACIALLSLLIYYNIFGFRLILGFRGSAGFGFGDGFSPESGFGAGSGFNFRFRFWVPRDSTRSESAPLPSLLTPVLAASRGHRHCLVIQLHHLPRSSRGCRPTSSHAATTWPHTQSRSLATSALHVTDCGRWAHKPPRTVDLRPARYLPHASLFFSTDWWLYLWTP